MNIYFHFYSLFAVEHIICFIMNEFPLFISSLLLSMVLSVIRPLMKAVRSSILGQLPYVQQISILYILQV